MASPPDTELPPSRETMLVVLLGASIYPRKPAWRTPVLGTSAAAVFEYAIAASGMAVPTGQVLNLFDDGDPAVRQCETIERFLHTMPMLEI